MVAITLTVTMISAVMVHEQDFPTVEAPRRARSTHVHVGRVSPVVPASRQAVVNSGRDLVIGCWTHHEESTVLRNQVSKHVTCAL